MSIRFAQFTQPRHQMISRCAALVMMALMCFAATAAGNAPDALARYQLEKEACIKGQSHQDRATCLKEAGAALAEARSGKPIPEQANYDQHALARCNAFTGDDRDACQRRIRGEGSSSGSVEGGGLIRTIVTPVRVAPDPAAPDQAAPAGQPQAQQPQQPQQQQQQQHQ